MECNYTKYQGTDGSSQRGNLFGWWKYLKESGVEEVRLSCSNINIIPAIAARLCKCKVVIILTAHHELQKVSKLLLMLSSRIIPASSSLSDALKMKQFTKNKVVESDSICKERSESGLSLKRSAEHNVLALSGEHDIEGLFQIFRICAIVQRVIPDIKLGICGEGTKIKMIVDEWQQQYSAPGMCFFVANTDDSNNNSYCFRAALSGPGIVDSPVILESAIKAGITVIADSKSVIDFPDADNCNWVEGARIRQYASALYKVLK